MLTWIVLVLLTLWLLRQRVGKEKINTDLPLGLPEGTIRGLLALVVVSFPFTFFWRDEPVPSIVSNMVFVIIAFYFEKRSHGTPIKEVLAQISEEKKKITRDQLPMYWPKYTVRSLLIVLVIVLFINSYLVTNPMPPVINTFVDIIAMVGSFIIGMAGHSIEIRMFKHKVLKRKAKTSETLQQAAQALEKESRAKNSKLGSLVAYLVCAALFFSLFLFTFNLSINIPLVYGLELPIREALFMSVNVYFGFRQ
jgi:hypothetical protein